MKNLVIMLMLLVVSFGGLSAQGRGDVKSLAVDTLQGNETVNFEAIQLTGDYNSLVIQALCTQTGGTSDGSLILKASVDGTTYTTINTTTDLLAAFPNDTLTITNGASVQWVLGSTPWRYYRVSGAGTVNDSTQVTIKYIIK